jgi:hypothetical protein
MFWNSMTVSVFFCVCLSSFFHPLCQTLDSTFNLETFAWRVTFPNDFSLFVVLVIYCLWIPLLHLSETSTFSFRTCWIDCIFFCYFLFPIFYLVFFIVLLSWEILNNIPSKEKICGEYIWVTTYCVSLSKIPDITYKYFANKMPLKFSKSSIKNS